MSYIKDEDLILECYYIIEGLWKKSNINLMGSDTQRVQELIENLKERLKDKIK